MSAVRGVRASLPPDTVAGRLDGTGAAQAVPLADLAQALAGGRNPLALASGLVAETRRAKAAEAAETARALAAEALAAPKASPVFTGTIRASLFPVAANDIAAAVAGVPVGGLYVTSASVVMQRRA